MQLGFFKKQKSNDWKWTMKNDYPKEKTKLSGETLRNAQTFPQDFKFNSNLAGNICYLCGMSVPPVMMKRVVTRLIESGIFDYKLGAN